MGIGAVATIAAGVLAVGCSSGSSGGGGGFTGINTDTPDQTFTATSIKSNNLDTDGAAFTPNNTNFADLKVVFADDKGGSDGTFGGDSTAMAILQVNDNDGSNHKRVLASHYSGGVFTPPVELQAEDRDETVSTNIQAVVAIELCTAAYGTASSTVINDVRGNNGAWLVLWDYTTLFQDPRLALNSTTSGAVGAHRTIGATVFLKEHRGTAVTTSSKVGATARTFRYGFQEVALEVPSIRTGQVTGHTVANVQQPNNNPPAANVTSFGLISNGFCGQSSFGGTTLPFSDTIQPQAGRGGGNTAANVNTNAAGAFTFAHPNQNGAVLRSASYEVGERTDFIHLFYTQIVSSLAGGGTFTQSGIAGGNVSDGGADLAAFSSSFNLATLTFGAKTEFTPPVERNGTATALRAGTAFYPSFYTYNQHLFFKYADGSLNTNSGITTIINQDLLLLNPVGTSLTQDRVFNHEGKSLPPAGVFYEDIIGFATVVDANDGTSNIGAANAKRDLSFHGTAGAHNTTNPSNTSGSIAPPNNTNTLPNREMMNFNGSGTFIFGADEGLGDTTIFYLAADSTRDSAGALAGDLNSTNIDATIAVAVVNNDGSFAAGVNPRRVSVHKGDFFGTTDLLLTNGNGTSASSTETNGLQDPPVEQGDLSGIGGTLVGRNGSGGVGAVAVFGKGNVLALRPGTAAPVLATVPTYFRTAMNRTGEYVALNWIQDSGQSSLGSTGGGTGFYQALFATVYQTFRPATTGTGTAAAAAAVEARFATAPVEVSTPSGSLALAQNLARAGNAAFVPNFNGAVQQNGPESQNSWIALPVNWSSFQGGLGYRTGWQSNRLIMNMFWEQSDGTEDRLFTRDLLVTLGATGTPTITLGTAAEFESTPSVQGHQSVNEFTTANTAQVNGPALSSINTFRFLDGGIYSFASTDLGPDATTLSATNQGGVLVVLGKVADGTSSDNDLADSELLAFEVLRGSATIGNRTLLSRNINENAALVGVQQGGEEGGGPGAPVAAGTLTQLLSTNAAAAGANYNGVFDSGSLLRLVASPRNTDIVGSPSFAATRVDVVFSDSRTDNNSGARVLWARKYDSKDRSTAAPKATVGERFTPNGLVGATQPLEPTRLDRLQGGNVTGIVVADTRASSMFIVWTQDGHGWAQYTSDGTTYVTTASAPTPPLVDDNNSINLAALRYSKGENSSGDVADGLMLITKTDVDGNDTRGYFRTLVITR